MVASAGQAVAGGGAHAVQGVRGRAADAMVLAAAAVAMAAEAAAVARATACRVVAVAGAVAAAFKEAAGEATDAFSEEAGYGGGAEKEVLRTINVADDDCSSPPSVLPLEEGGGTHAHPPSRRGILVGGCPPERRPSGAVALGEGTPECVGPRVGGPLRVVEVGEDGGSRGLC